MKSLISQFYTGARVSALAAVMVSASYGGAAAWTCSEVWNSWPTTINSTVCSPDPGVQACIKANAAVATIKTACCPTSGTVPVVTCIPTNCSGVTKSSLAAAGIDCNS